MLIASETTNKLLLVLVISCFSSACSNKALEFDSQCQSGWTAQFPLSNVIYKRLSEHKYVRYIAVKRGSDRGAYSFYFIGQFDKAGIFLHATQNELTLNTISLADIDKAFSLLPEDIQKLKDYTGSGEIWTHLACDYMQIKTTATSTTLSFRDHILKESLQEPIASQGVAALVRIKEYLNDYMLDSVKKRPGELVIINVDNMEHLNDEVVAELKARKTRAPLFYEIP